MDELSSYLLSGKHHASISPETLEMLGKKAATAFLSDNIPLNDAIAKLAAEHHDISPEQIKRVVEFANTSVYLAKHDQAKTAGSEHSYPQFELADAGRIIQDMSDGARPTVVTKTDIDYNRQAQKPKLSSAPLEQALADLFKTASEEQDYSEETIASQLLAAKDLLTGLRDNLVDTYNQHEGVFKEAAADFYSQAKNHLMDGGSLAEVVIAAQSTGADSDTVNQVMGPVVQRLISEKVASPLALKRDMAALDKVAHRIVNPEHDLVKSFSATILAGHEMKVASMALGEISEELSQVQDFLKKAYFDKEAVAGLLARVPGALASTGKTIARNFRKDPLGTAFMAHSMMPQRAPTPPMHTDPYR